MGYVINLLNFPIIAKKSSFSFVPLPMKLGITLYLSVALPLILIFKLC
ncbi:MAG: hypothetical protein ACR5K9_10290 [Wolbachia sp.]